MANTVIIKSLGFSYWSNCLNTTEYQKYPGSFSPSLDALVQHLVATPPLHCSTCREAPRSHHSMCCEDNQYGRFVIIFSGLHGPTSALFSSLLWVTPQTFSLPSPWRWIYSRWKQIAASLDCFHLLCGGINSISLTGRRLAACCPEYTGTGQILQTTAGVNHSRDAKLSLAIIEIRDKTWTDILRNLFLLDWTELYIKWTCKKPDWNSSLKDLTTVHYLLSPCFGFLHV